MNPISLLLHPGTYIYLVIKLDLVGFDFHKKLTYGRHIEGERRRGFSGSIYYFLFCSLVCRIISFRVIERYINCLIYCILFYALMCDITVTPIYATGKRYRVSSLQVLVSTSPLALFFFRRLQ